MSLPYRAALLALVLAFGPLKGIAMNMNLPVPWGAKCSPPHTADLVVTSPQADDLLFSQGEEIELHLQSGLRTVAVGWSLSRNLLLRPFRTGMAEPRLGNRFVVRLPTAGLTPGFYDVRFAVDAGLDQPLQAVATFGWQADRLPIPQNRPADFTAFWTRALATLEVLPLVPQEGPETTYDQAAIAAYNRQHACLPADYDPAGRRAETVVSRKVNFIGPEGGRVYGWLAKPEGNGPFPAMLILPGAGNGARPRPLEHARHGYVALDIQIHGLDVDLEQYPPVAGYYDNVRHDPPEAYYYYLVHLRCVQAVRYLLARPDVDPRRVVIVGGSQGGRLGIVTAALEPRVAAVVAAIPNSANLPYLDWARACGAVANLYPKRSDQPPPEAWRDGLDTPLPPLADTPAQRCFTYYDPMNFAPDLRCPILVNCGLIDPISPPTSVWAAYLRLGSTDKRLLALPGLAHDWSPEFDRQAWRWLDRVLAPPAGGQ